MPARALRVASRREEERLSNPTIFNNNESIGLPRSTMANATLRERYARNDQRDKQKNIWSFILKRY